MTQNNELLKVDIISEEGLTQAQYIKTALIKAKREDGREIFWEMEKGHDSVHVLVDNIEEERIEIVAQVRVPLKVNNPETNGIAFEACAGLVDKKASIIQIAKEELQEEMGYDVALDKITPVRVYSSNVGKSGGSVHTFKCCVLNSDKTTAGGGLDSEDISIVTIPYDEVRDFIDGTGAFENIFTDATTLFLIQDWLIERLTNA